MNDSATLSEDQRDCLQELMNVAYGSATAAISSIIDSYATLNIPEINTIEAKSLKSYLSSQSEFNSLNFVSSQLINGDIAGESLFVIDYTSAMNLAVEFGLNDDEIDDEELSDIILEVANILSSATIGKLAAQLDTKISFSPPSVQKLKTIMELDNRYLEDYSSVIVIATRLEFKDQKIDGELLILAKDESIQWIKKAIDHILEEL